jgi:hypothetical protein
MSDSVRNLEITVPTTSLELKHSRGYFNKQIQKLRIRNDKFVILSPGRLRRKSERNLEFSNREKLRILFVHSDKYGNPSHYPAS